MGVAIKVLHDIDAFQDLLTQQEVQQVGWRLVTTLHMPRDSKGWMASLWICSCDP